MKTVLSIDFDIIMAPTIELYNNLVPKVSWEEMDKAHPLCGLAYPDCNHYQGLVNHILKTIQNIPNKENVFIIENHGKLYDVIPFAEKVHLINIDHHHDVFYPSDEPDKKVNCANWALKLRDANRLESYTWVKNENSVRVEEKYKHYIDKEYNFAEVVDRKIELPSPDILVLCLSEPWVPDRYRPLFFLILDLLNNHYKTHFDIIYGDSNF